MLDKYTYIIAYQISSCCTSSKRAVFACYKTVSNVMNNNSKNGMLKYWYSDQVT